MDGGERKLSEVEGGPKVVTEQCLNSNDREEQRENKRLGRQENEKKHKDKSRRKVPQKNSDDTEVGEWRGRTTMAEMRKC